jgi:hypothetical protein
MITNGPALVLLLPIAGYGLLRTVKDVKSAWVHRHDPSPVSRVGRVRLGAWLLSLLCAGVMAGDLLLHGPRWIALTGFGGIFVGWLVYLALSFFWGALGGPQD